MFISLFFFNDTSTTEIYTLSLHDALPISPGRRSASRRNPVSRGHDRSTSRGSSPHGTWLRGRSWFPWARRADRKSTRLNSSHVSISYAVFCLKKKKKNIIYYIHI